MLSDLVKVLVKGVMLSLLYFQTTLANDTTIQNICLFTMFYTIMHYGALLTDVSSSVVTNAFITKTIFTLVEERIKKPKQQD